MLDNSRVSDWFLGAVLALVSHSAVGQTPPAQPPIPPSEAEMRNATIVCGTITRLFASSTGSPTGGELPFAYGIAPVAGVPYSAVGVTDSATTFVGGNRINRHETTRFFRDGQGRTRIEHTSPLPQAALSALPRAATILINDPMSGECYVLDATQKIAHVFSHPDNRGVIHPPIEPGVPPARFVMPGFDLAQGAFAITANYSSPEDQVSLGNKTIEGISAVGTRVNHRIRTGDFGNEQPILVTVEHWFSRDLGITLEDIQHTTIGGKINYRLQEITRSEPDPALFKVPPGYTRKLEPTPQLSASIVTRTPPKVMMVRPPSPARRLGPVPCPPGETSPRVAGCLGEISP